MNPTLRGFLLIVAVAAVITAFQLQAGLTAIVLVLAVVFYAVLLYVVFRLWRTHRGEIGTWPVRARVAFYGAGLLAFANVTARFVLPYPRGALESLVFFVVLAAAGFAMWRVWREQRTYGY